MSRLPFPPDSVDGSVEGHLPAVRTALVRTLTRAQKDFRHSTLKLRRPSLEALAAILVEFAADLHCGIGIWRSLEHYHRQFFGAALPLIPEAESDRPPTEISPARIRHLLWILYPQMIPDLIIAPAHADLVRLSDGVARFLQDQFTGLPTNSDVGQLLATPNEQGWEVKRKLVWLGTQSYFFRIFCECYVKAQKAELSDITIVDDFLCQECTEWSGLGALEILAEVLGLPPERRTDLLAWSERHNAVYEILAASKARMEVLNVINDRKYHVRMNVDRNPFQRGSFVHGSLVPWRGGWCWSGTQTVLDRLDEATIARLKQDYRKRPNMYYRMCLEDLTKARNVVGEQHDEFTARHGKDWVVYPDGLTMAADWQLAAKAKFDALPPAEREKLVQRHGQHAASPQMNLPRELLESKGGICVYFNAKEGMEIVPDFDAILKGLRKKGVNLTPDEQDIIRGWVMGESISPSFVRALAGEYGDESIRAAFLLDTHWQNHALEYLIRRYKGRFFRPRYPNLTVAG